MKQLAAFVAILSISACATAELTDGGRHVRFVTTSPSGCKYLGEIVGDFRGSKTGGIATDTNELARVDAKNETAKAGGNTLQILENGERQVKGEAYDCADSR